MEWYEYFVIAHQDQVKIFPRESNYTVLGYRYLNTYSLLPTSSIQISLNESVFSKVFQKDPLVPSQG